MCKNEDNNSTHTDLLVWIIKGLTNGEFGTWHIGSTLDILASVIVCLDQGPLLCAFIVLCVFSSQSVFFLLHYAYNIIDISLKLSWLYVCLLNYFGLFQCKQILLHPQYLEWLLAHGKPSTDIYCRNEWMNEWMNEWPALIIICPCVVIWLNSICLSPTQEASWEYHRSSLYPSALCLAHRGFSISAC